MHKKLLILFSSLFFFSTLLSAQDCSIELDFSNITKQKIYLAYYYNGQVFIRDSTTIDKQGKGVFNSENKLPEGIYQLYMNAKEHYDFLLGEEQNISISKKNNEVSFAGAKQTRKFNEYLTFLEKQKAAQKAYSEKKSTYQQIPDSVEKYNQLLLQLDAKIKNYWLQESEENPNTFYAKFLLSNYIPKPDEVFTNVYRSDSLQWVYEYNFRQNHYWDYFDLSDSRMWRTPTIKSHLETYFNTILLQKPDTIIKQANKLIEQVKDTPEAYQNLLSFILNNSYQSNIMGMENAFVTIAEKYYLNETPDWVNQETLEKIKTEVYFRKNNLLGMKSKELLLEDKDGNYHSLHQLSTPYTLLVFWEPACGHCKKEIPKLYEEVFLKADPSKLSIYTVYTQDNREEWLDFIEEHQLTDWLNVWDPDQSSQFQILYDVRSTPAIYILDNEKRIIAKRVSVESAKNILKSQSVSFDN